MDTLRFGRIEIDVDQQFQFPQGLPGFEHLRRFAMLTPDPELPFSFLQSLEDGEVAFILTNPFLFYSRFEFKLSDEDQQLLGIKQPEDVAVWAIVTVHDDIAAGTLNLLAPVVINIHTRRGKQIILQGSGYQTRHPLFPEGIPNAPTAKEAGGC